MPTITVKKNDLEDLLGEEVSLSRLETLVHWVKGEIKEYQESTGELKIELSDSNRPDLWCVEGIARQIRCGLERLPVRYPFQDSKKAKSKYQIQVDPGLREIRPFIGAVVARGLNVSEAMLAQIIQTQEKLSDIFGRKRHTVSIGYYRLSGISFPVSYKTVFPDEVRFIPLDFEEPMSPREILKKHPKGIQYGHLLASSPRYPILMDSRNKILSLPPIINSRELGEVQVGDQELLVEATGTDLRMLVVVMNILAANLYDRGARIETVEILYPYPTDLGRSVKMPLSLSRPMRLTSKDVHKALGEQMEVKELRALLQAYGYEVQGRGQAVVVKGPFYRDDVMHGVDVIEDVAISRGYNNFSPMMPSQFTVGSLSSLERLSDRVRELMVGFGFQEVISNILMSKADLLDRMGLEEKVVEVENSISQQFAILRQWIIPSLLRVEAASSKSFYPHRIFEAGEVAVHDPDSDIGSRTILRLAGLIAHPTASFSEMHSFLEMLFYYLGRDCSLEPIRHASFIPGRVGRIKMQDREIGFIGELHPQVLENWEIHMPCGVFELTLDRLLTNEF
jgi:phenylalanyl-tRNA synthetase beta chain